jgi:hypothetical protein
MAEICTSVPTPSSAAIRATRAAPWCCTRPKVFLPRSEDADAVHHRIRAMDRRAHAVVVADIGEDRLHLTDRAIGTHEDRFVRAADGHAYAPALLGHAARDIAADKARSTKYRDEFRHARDPPEGTSAGDRRPLSGHKAQIVPMVLKNTQRRLALTGYRLMCRADGDAFRFIAICAPSGAPPCPHRAGGEPVRARRGGGAGRPAARTRCCFRSPRNDGAHAQDIVAAARADYARLVGTLYQFGHFAPVVRITS